MTDRPHPPGDDPRPPVDGATLLAYLLGELPPAEHTRIETALEADPELQAEARRLEASTRALQETLTLSPLDEDGSPLRMRSDRRADLLAQLGQEPKRARFAWRNLATTPLVPLGLAAVLALGVFTLLPTHFFEQATSTGQMNVDTVRIEPPLLEEPPPPPQEAEELEPMAQMEIVRAPELDLPELERLELSVPSAIARAGSGTAPQVYSGALEDKIVAYAEPETVFEFSPRETDVYADSDEAPAAPAVRNPFMPSDLAARASSPPPAAPPAAPTVRPRIVYSNEAPDPNDVIELDSFVVSADEDVGYLSTNSVSGTRVSVPPQLRHDFTGPKGIGATTTTRLQMQIRDLPTSTDVVSQEFLEDTQATDFKESLSYSAGIFTDEVKSPDTPVYGVATSPVPPAPARTKPTETSTRPADKTAPASSLVEGLLSSVPSNSTTDAAALGSETDAAGEEETAPIEAIPLTDLSVYPKIETSNDPISTFSLNVSDASFRLAQAALGRHRLPTAGTLRTEEFVNAFDYGDPAPRPGQAVAMTAESAHWPYGVGQEVLRISLETAATGRLPQNPLNLVLVLDTSGSMARADRRAILHAALDALANQLQPQDTLSIVAFSRTPTLLLDGESGQSAAALRELVDTFNPQGGTHLEDALRLGYATATRHFRAAGQNRVVLLTDGATNLGEAAPEALAKTVEAHRVARIALDVFGVGYEGHNDVLLERLARHGDGRYRFLRHEEDARNELGEKLAGILRPAAYDVKVQVEFNPRRVRSYQQLGYHQHQLRDEDFRDNTVDAAEMAAAETGTALYLVEPLPGGSGPLAIVRIRYRDARTGSYAEHSWNFDPGNDTPAWEDASPALRLASGAALFAAFLNQSPLAADIAPGDLEALTRDLPEAFPGQPRVARFIRMLQTYRQLVDRP